MLKCFSPTLTGKKSNELIQGGLSSIKNAATSVAKKLDEIKEAISANTTPVKSNNSNDRNANQVGPEDDTLNNSNKYTRSHRINCEIDIWGRLNESRKSSSSSLVPVGENTATSYAPSFKNYSYPVLPDGIYVNESEV